MPFLKSGPLTPFMGPSPNCVIFLRIQNSYTVHTQMLCRCPPYELLTGGSEKTLQPALYLDMDTARVIA